MLPIFWVTHPRHMPKPQDKRAVVLDVAFAAGNQYRSKTRPFIDGLGENLVRWVDHHVHKEGWAEVNDDSRYLLVPNKIAHACPELITPELIAAAHDDVGKPQIIYAHCDFDGLLSAVKWRLGGKEAWPGADEDARAVDSPGRGHLLTKKGEHIAWAMDEASAIYDRKERLRFMSDTADAITKDEWSIAFEEETRSLAEAGENAEKEARAMALDCGKEEAKGLFVVRADEKLQNRQRRLMLIVGEEKASIGALYEPDPQGGAWVYAATFDQRLDLEEVKGFAGGRSDFRFARAKTGGGKELDALAAYLDSLELDDNDA
ncbi:MAG: hypothetical protein GY822_11680 [Deltaproteobacteria bacterium]|nr:hypothetical protein [Deltaproteobacteria bacterium]